MEVLGELRESVELIARQMALENRESHPRELHSKPYTIKPIFSNGGVYDNMGLETVFTVFVSDAGAPFKSKKRVWGFWIRARRSLLAQ